MTAPTRLATNTTDLLHEIRRGSEALIAGDALDNAVAEWLAITHEEMEYDGAYEAVVFVDGETSRQVVTDMDVPQPDWTVALKVARAALERAEATR